MAVGVALPGRSELCAPRGQIVANLLSESRLIDRGGGQGRNLPSQVDDCRMTLAVPAAEANELLLRFRESIDAAEDGLPSLIHHGAIARCLGKLRLEQRLAFPRPQTA